MRRFDRIVVVLSVATIPLAIIVGIFVFPNVFFKITNAGQIEKPFTSSAEMFMQGSVNRVIDVNLQNRPVYDEARVLCGSASVTENPEPDPSSVTKLECRTPSDWMMSGGLWVVTLFGVPIAAYGGRLIARWVGKGK